MSSVRLAGVSKRFAGRDALRDFSTTFEPGMNLLVGPNGSGKTTVLNLVAGVLAPDAGSVMVLERPADAAKGRVFLAPSAAPAIPWLTGRAFIAFTSSLFKGRLARDAVEEILEGFALGPHIDKPLGEMSSGTAKKVVIAAAFASGAPVLLFDEPTNELDSASIDFFLRTIGAAMDKIVVVATHRTEQFEGIASRRIPLNWRDQPRGE